MKIGCHWNKLYLAHRFLTSLFLMTRIRPLIPLKQWDIREGWEIREENNGEKDEMGEGGHRPGWGGRELEENEGKKLLEEELWKEVKYRRMTGDYENKCWKFKKFSSSLPPSFLSFLSPFFLPSSLPPSFLSLLPTLISKEQSDTQYSTSIFWVLKMQTWIKHSPCMQGVYSILEGGRVFNVWQGVERLSYKECLHSKGSGSILLGEGEEGQGGFMELEGLMTWEEFLCSSINAAPL